MSVDLRTSGALFERIFEYLDLPVDVAPGKLELGPRPQGRVALDDVWFRYEDEGRWTLQGVDLEVEPGAKVAIVGETGSGKTTLGYLVARLYDAVRG